MLVLNAMVRKSSDLLEFNQNPQCNNVFIQVRNICFTDASHLVLLDILFVLKVKLLFCQFTAVHFDSQIYFCVVMQVELLESDF